MGLENNYCTACNHNALDCRCVELKKRQREVEKRLKDLLGVDGVFLSKEGGWYTIRLKLKEY